MTFVYCTDILYKDSNKGIIDKFIMHTTDSSDSPAIRIHYDVLLKRLKSEKIHVDILTLDKDKCAIIKRESTVPDKEGIKYVDGKQLYNAAVITGKHIDVLFNNDGWECPCFIINNRNNEYILYIPSDIIAANLISSTDIHKALKSLSIDYYGHLNLTVIGGKGLLSVSDLFRECKFHKLDVSKMYTHRVEDMTRMFYKVECDSLLLKGMDTSKVIDMSSMFGNARIKSIDGFYFDTCNVIDMAGMFSNATITSDIDLGSFDTSNVKDFSKMFERCRAHSINVKSFNTSQATSMMRMFESCDVANIDLSSFDVNRAVEYEKSSPLVNSGGIDRMLLTSHVDSYIIPSNLLKHYINVDIDEYARIAKKLDLFSRKEDHYGKV